MLQTNRRSAFLAMGLSSFMLPAYLNAAPTFTIEGLWENKYVLEGRNALADGGIFSLTGTAILGSGISVGTRFVTGDSDDYEELQAFVEYGIETDVFEAYVGYRGLAFFEDGGSDKDNEISIALIVNDLSPITLGLDYIYSMEAEGGFLEISLRSEIMLFKKQLTLEPYVLEGFDFGYASKAYDGPNNFQIGIDFSTPVADRMEVVGSINHSWAHEDVKNEGLGDVSWAMIGLTVAF